MKTILVVDDEVSIAQVLQMLLTEEGYRVEIASNGQEGLARASELYPDLVLLDVMMPVMDGREMCRALQNNPELRRVPVVVMSAARTIPKEECNYACFIAKPFDLETVFTVVERVIGRPDDSATEGRDAVA